MASFESPKDVPTFLACFPNWPAESLEHRTDIEAGSRWGLREIGTFKLLRQKLGNRFPVSLSDTYAEAERRVETSPDIQAAINLLGSEWRQYNRAKLLRLAGIFAPFFSLLAEVLEQPVTPNPDRYLRGMEIISGSSHSSSSSEAPSSPLEPPAKRLRETHSADSYHPSYQSDQSTHDRQIKSEITTNACVFHFLQCVTESVRKDNDEHSFRLEWALSQDTFHVETPKCQFSSTNDGSLIYRDGSSGYWKRRTNLCYCSIEAKSRYTLTSNTTAIEAQEGAHMIGILSQRLSSQQHEQQQKQGSIDPSEIIPLISARQNMFYIIIGTFSKAYCHYLQTGTEVDPLSLSAFGQLDEYGPFDVKDAEDFEMMCSICVALVLYMEGLCALSSS